MLNLLRKVDLQKSSFFANYNAKCNFTATIRADLFLIFFFVYFTFVHKWCQCTYTHKTKKNLSLKNEANNFLKHNLWPNHSRNWQIFEIECCKLFFFCVVV